MQIISQSTAKPKKEVHFVKEQRRVGKNAIAEADKQINLKRITTVGQPTDVAVKLQLTVRMNRGLKENLSENPAHILISSRKSNYF